MFNTTHSLVGLAAARAVWPDEKHRRACLWAGLLAANLPDLDSFAALWGPRAYREIHHGLSHSLVFWPAASLLFALLFRPAWRALHRRAAAGKSSDDEPAGRPGRLPFRPLFFAVAAAWLTHLFVDWLPSYRLRPFLPFSDKWIGADLTFFLDPYLDALLLASLLFFRRRRQRKYDAALSATADFSAASRAVRRGATATLLLFCLYLGVTAATREAAWRATTVRDGGAPAALLPAPLRPGVWLRLDRHRSAAGGVRWVCAEVGPAQWWSGRPAKVLGTARGDSPDRPAVAATRSSPAVRSFLRFSRFPLVNVLPPQADGGVWVVWSDAYLNRRLPLWPGMNAAPDPPLSRAPPRGGSELRSFARLYVRVKDGRVVEVGP